MAIEIEPLEKAIEQVEDISETLAETVEHVPYEPGHWLDYSAIMNNDITMFLGIILLVFLIAVLAKPIIAIIKYGIIFFMFYMIYSIYAQI
jgi:hypothetical protein